MSDGKKFKGEASLEDWLDRHHVDVIRTYTTGLDGQGIGKYLNRSKFLKTLPEGGGIADMALASSIAGDVHMTFWHPFRHATLGDVTLKPDLDTLVSDGVDPNLGHCLCDFAAIDGTPIPLCPRTMLKNVVAEVRNAGFEVKATYELEFFLFNNSYAQARQQGYKNLAPIGASALQTVYLVRNAFHAKTFMDEVTKRLDWYGIEWEGWNDEFGLGQLELNLTPGEPLQLADAVVRSKQIIYEVAVEFDMAATFMAHPVHGYSSGMHIHHSLYRDGQAAFFDEQAPDHHSALMKHWIAGLIQTMPAAVSYLCPTINSFRRMTDFTAPPMTATWGEENKSAALRLITRTPSTTRLEHRVGAADMNPYLALAVILAGGLAGHRHQLPLPAELTDLGWGLPASFERLPLSITKAAAALQADTLLREVLGGEEIDYWVNTRKHEWFSFHTGGGDASSHGTTDWEYQHYFELI